MTKAIRPLETRWRCVPEREVPLRLVMVNLSAAALGRLEDWAARQACPAVNAWLAGRETACMEAQANHPGPQPVRDAAAEAAWRRGIRATALVDLLVWQSGCQDGKAALDWLQRTQAGMDACEADLRAVDFVKAWWQWKRTERLTEPTAAEFGLQETLAAVLRRQCEGEAKLL